MGLNGMVADMKMPARMDCSRRPMEMAMPMAITEALAEYSSQRQYGKASSS